MAIKTQETRHLIITKTGTDNPILFSDMGPSIEKTQEVYARPRQVMSTARSRYTLGIEDHTWSIDYWMDDDLNNFLEVGDEVEAVDKPDPDRSECVVLTAFITGNRINYETEAGTDMTMELKRSRDNEGGIETNTHTFIVESDSGFEWSENNFDLNSLSGIWTDLHVHVYIHRGGADDMVLTVATNDAATVGAYTNAESTLNLDGTNGTIDKSIKLNKVGANLRRYLRIAIAASAAFSGTIVIGTSYTDPN